MVITSVVGQALLTWADCTCLSRSTRREMAPSSTQMSGWPRVTRAAASTCPAETALPLPATRTERTTSSEEPSSAQAITPTITTAVPAKKTAFQCGRGSLPRPCQGHRMRRRGARGAGRVRCRGRAPSLVPGPGPPERRVGPETLLAPGSDPPEPPGGLRPGSSVTGPWPELARGAVGLDPAPWRAIAECDSVVVDPHKHGLQPYGCGAVLFSDPEVGRFYLHDSPYTYFTSDELHLGEISLECSRAGASAAALWLTLQLLPLTPDGLGRVLAACRRAALGWAALIDGSSLLDLYQPPELDIVCYFPRLPGATMSGIDEASVSMLARGMKASRPVFLSTLRVTAAGMSSRHPGVRADQDGARIL